MNKTKIVCTIGPACSNLETLKEMMLAGMDVARFNMSHGTHESHRELMNLVKQARFELGLPVAIMLDTKGPEIRIKQFKEGKVWLEDGQSFAITTENVVGDETIVSVTYSKLPEIVRKGTRILLNDGLIELVVEKKTDKVIYTKVEVGGELSNNKSINIPSVELNMDYLSDADKADIAFGVQENVDVYSISFVNHDKDVKTVRKYLKELGVEVDVYQSNIEGEIVEKIQQARGVYDGILINAGGYTHTSVVIRDAIAAVQIPTIEVHMTNIHAREEFRHTSLLSGVCKAIVAGFGDDSYILALEGLIRSLS